MHGDTIASVSLHLSKCRGTTNTPSRCQLYLPGTARNKTRGRDCCPLPAGSPETAIGSLPDTFANI